MDGALALTLGVLAAVIVALPLALWQHRRLAASRVRGLVLEAEVEKGRRMLAAAPDGLYVWDDASGTEHCSRRLAVLLDLAAGTEARIEDVLYRFSGDAAAALHQAVTGLRREGTGFDLALTTAGGQRSVHAVGVRCGAADGRPLADLLWMRDTDAWAGKVAVGGDAEGEAKRVRAFSTPCRYPCGCATPTSNSPSPTGLRAMARSPRPAVTWRCAPVTAAPPWPSRVW